MADVGRLAGVSATTVSFVINAMPGEVIRSETRQRVLPRSTSSATGRTAPLKVFERDAPR